MKTTKIHFNNLEEFEGLDPMLQRMAIVGIGGKYWKEFTTFSDDNGIIYIGRYIRRPFLSETGRVYLKTVCDSAVTFKNGKFYGDKHRIDMIDEFEPYHWLAGIKPRITTFPITVLRKILEKKITSQEGLWKAVAKTSYKDRHWKVVRFCKEHRIPLMLLQMVCPNHEAILKYRMPAFTYTLRINDLVRYAAITQTKIDITWSDRRMDEELEKMKSKVIDIQIQLKESTPIWNLESLPWPEDFWEFRLLNNERDVFATSEKFHNCIYRNYFEKMKGHKYIAFVSGDTCVGYQITDDRDVLLDQMRGVYNAQILSETQDRIDRLLRPIAQAIAEANPIVKDNLPF